MRTYVASAPPDNTGDPPSAEGGGYRPIGGKVHDLAASHPCLQDIVTGFLSPPVLRSAIHCVLASHRLFHSQRTVPTLSLPGVLDVLERHRQRATYGAVAELLGKTPRSLMQGLPKNWRNSFVVNQASGEPSEYHDLQKHPALREPETILSTPQELATFLRVQSG